MKIPIAQMKVYDWQGPTAGVKFRVVANQAFLARDDDDTGFQVDANPKVFREVDCTFAIEVINGINVKVLTVPALWLFSTTDAIVNRLARYSAFYYTASGGKIRNADQLQNFQLGAALIEIFNPVPWSEVIRFNNPASPIPFDVSTFSREQILEMIGQGPVNVANDGSNIAKRIAFWVTPTTIGGFTAFSDTVFEGQDGDPILRLTTFSGSRNMFVIEQDSAVNNPKVVGFGSALNLHLADANTQWHLIYSNDAAPVNWANNNFNSGRLEFQAYTPAPADELQSRCGFDHRAGVGISKPTINLDYGWFFRDADGFHLGVSTNNAGIDVANRQISFVQANTGVGINKPTAIGAQLHVVSGAAARPGFIIDSAASPSQPLAILRNNTSQRFLFDHDARAEFGLQEVVKGRLSFAVAANTNKTSLEAADTPASSVVYKMPAADPANGQLLRTLTFAGGVATLEWVNPTAGGDVSSDIETVVDNKLTRFQGTTGKLITDSAITVADTSGSFTVPDGWAVTNAGGSSITLQTVSHIFSSPTRATTGQIFEFTSASQTQSSGVIEVAKFITTYNQTSTAGSTDISIARTHTAIGSGEHNFIKGFVGGVPSFRINSVGNYFFGFTNSHIGDANGNELLRFDHVASAVSEFRITNAALTDRPKFEVTSDNANQGMQIAGKGTGNIQFVSDVEIRKTSPRFIIANTPNADSVTFEFSANDVFRLLNDNGGTTVWEANLANNVVTFSAIPVGPASNPTTANQLTRKDYVDTRKSYFALVWFVLDPTTPAIGSQAELPWWSAPDGASGMKLTKMKIFRAGGSHTAGGSVTFKLQSNSADVGVLSFNDTNNAAFTYYTDDFADVTPAAVNVIISARSGTVSERSVSIQAEGFQNLAA